MSLQIGDDVAVLAFSLLGTSMSLTIGGDVAVLVRMSARFMNKKGEIGRKCRKVLAFGRAAVDRGGCARSGDFGVLRGPSGGSLGGPGPRVLAFGSKGGK
jgi:hypothetical protein